MLIRRLRALVKDLNSIRFVGLKIYDIGSAMNVTLLCNIFLRSVTPNVWRMLFATSFRRIDGYSLVSKADAKLLFFFSDEYRRRNDLEGMFRKVADLCVDKDIMTPGMLEKRFDATGVKFLFFIPIWLLQIRRFRLSLQEKLILISKIIFIKKWVEYLQRHIDPNKYGLLMTLCDAHVIDNIITQYFKKAGIFTATLQHGWCTRSLPDADNFNGIALHFEGFVSDFFLAWGEVAKARAIQSGLPANKIFCTGHPNYIGVHKVQQKLFPSKTIGILLTRSIEPYKTENINLIQIVNIIAQNYGLKYIVRYHPADSITDIREYEKIMHQEFFHGISNKDSTLEALIADIDFFIVGSSSVYAELLFLGAVSFRYTGINDFYDEVQWGKFTNADELISIINDENIDKTKCMERVLQYGELLCGQGDIAENYRDFFRKSLDRI